MSALDSPPTGYTTPRPHHISGWDAEDVQAWEAGGKDVAARNLLWSVVTEHVGFSVWSLWSVLVLFMPNAVYGLDAAGKFYLVAMPTLVGALLRIPYTVATAKFGGRNWTVVSALVLLVPTVLALYVTWGATKADHPSYTTLLVIAAVAGFGGGNFASSMTNINAFYPQRLKGWALGLNAGGGNIGVPAIQLVGLLIIALTTPANPTILCAVYLVVIALAAVGAALFMDNLDNQRSDLRSMGQVLKTSDAWVVALLYIGTFGSFIGFSFAFGQILQIGFLADLNTGVAKTLADGTANPVLAAHAATATLHAAQIAFIGPLLGSLARPLGGKLADRVGGAKISLYTFAAMVVCIGVVVGASTIADGNGGVARGGTLVAFLGGFILLFVLTGVGNGSVYKMIPGIYAARSRALVEAGGSEIEAGSWSRAMSGALIGFAGAIGALGGVAINVVLRSSYASTKSATSAFWVVLAFYLVCAVVTWAVYLRRRPDARSSADHRSRVAVEV
jgi:NNP family nitrate/nitrite transporter-like MFS transporter